MPSSHPSSGAAPLRPTELRARALLAAAAAAALTACSGGGGGSSLFVTNSTSEAVSATGRVVISREWIVFQADEATNGMDFNGDGDMIDQIATVVNVFTGSDQTLDVAAVDMAVASDEVYLHVDEALDGRDWNTDADMADDVLLHWSASSGVLTYVDDLDATGPVPFLSVDDRLYYDSLTTGAAGETTIMVLEPSMPTTPMVVMDVDNANMHAPDLLGVDDELIFLLQDETVEGRDVNGDGDMNDTTVLALLNGDDISAMVRTTGFAVRDAMAPFRARRNSTTDWTVAFLVNEAAEGNSNLNDPMLFAGSWKPAQCNGFEDADTLDDVLFFLEFEDWFGDPAMFPPTNTGLVGGSAVMHPKRVVVVAGFVGVVSPEASEGTCDLNQDGDTTDFVVRWTSTNVPILPEGDPTLLLALATGVPGGTNGYADLNGRFVVVASEADEDMDIDGDGNMDDDLVGWLNPTNVGAPWEFDHSTTATPTFVGASWFDDDPDRDRVYVALQEEVFDDMNSINSSDMDVLDSVPTYGCFGCISGNTNDMDFPGIAVAVNSMAAGAGIREIRNVLWYRVSETEDNRDWNSDGDMNDQVLLRTTISSGTTAFTSTLTADSGTPAVLSDDGFNAVALRASEAAAGQDFNGDGDMTDRVLRWLRVF